MSNIRRFTLILLLFLLIVLLLVMGLWTVVTATRGEVCHNSNARVLVMGNSRIQYGFDDSKMSGMWNVGLNADNYNIIYWKLKMLHQCNPQIQKVLLEVDDVLLHSYFKGVEYKLHPYYWDQMDAGDWLRLIENDRTILMYPLDWVKTLYPVKSLWAPVSFKELGIGGYSRLQRDKLQESIQNEGKASVGGDGSGRPQKDQLQQYYLQRIIDYCRDNNVELEFINMPSYPTETVKQNNSELHQYVSQTYPDIPFHDFELLELPDSCYGDISHLNYRGAAVFASEWMESLQ